MLDERIEQDDKEKESQRSAEMVTPVITKDSTERDLLITGELTKQDQCLEDEEEDEEDEDERQKQPLQRVDTDDAIPPLSMQYVISL